MLPGVFTLPHLFMATFSLRDLYFQWESSGVFDFFLPALLIFAVVFGILTSSKILGGQRGVNFIIALAIAFISIRVPFVSSFFTTVFPNFGVALAIILIVVIMVGMFIIPTNAKVWFNILGYGALGVAVIVAVITFNQYDWFGSFWWQQNWVTVLFMVIAVLLLLPLFIEPKSLQDRIAEHKEFGITLPIKQGIRE